MDLNKFLLGNQPCTFPTRIPLPVGNRPSRCKIHISAYIKLCILVILNSRFSLTTCPQGNGPVIAPKVMVKVVNFDAILRTQGVIYECLIIKQKSRAPYFSSKLFTAVAIKKLDFFLQNIPGLNKPLRQKI